MTLEACIAHAIHSDLDILEALPEVRQIPLEELEDYVESFIVDVHQNLFHVITEKGEPYLRSKDAAGLCATCLQEGIELPAKLLLKMCQTILQLQEIDAQFILENDEGVSLYYVKMAIAA